jgi:hypothetical protein
VFSGVAASLLFSFGAHLEIKNRAIRPLPSLPRRNLDLASTRADANNIAIPRKASIHHIGGVPDESRRDE